MSNLFDLLKGIINKVNKAVSTDKQVLTDEQKAQVRENIGVGNTTPDWEENNPDASGYIKNRTHSKNIEIVSTQLDGVDIDITCKYIEEEKLYWTTSDICELDIDELLIGVDDTILVEVDGKSEICTTSYSDFDYVEWEADFSSGWIRAGSFTDSSYKNKLRIKVNKWTPEPITNSTVHISIHRASVTYSKLDPKYLTYSGPIDYTGYMYTGEDCNYSAPISGYNVARAFSELNEVRVKSYDDLPDRPVYTIPEHKDYNVYVDGSGGEVEYSCIVIGTDATSYGLSEEELSGNRVVSGNTYNVEFNHNTFILQAYSHPTESYKIILGNGYLYDTSLENTGESICVMIDYDAWYGRLYWDTTVYGRDIYYEYIPFSVYEIVPEEIKQLDEKYLPDSVVTEDEYITDEQFTILNNLLDGESEVTVNE